MEEPSVLDYLKALLTPWRGPVPEIPPLPAPGKRAKAQATRAKPKAKAKKATVTWALDLSAIPWRTSLSFILLLTAESFWQPPDGSWAVGGTLALAALGLIVWAAREGEWRLPQHAQEASDDSVLTLRRGPLVLGLALFALTFLTSSGNRFTPINVSLWLASIVAILAAFWQIKPSDRPIWERVKAWFQSGDLSLNVSRFGLLVILVVALVAFFRFSQLGSVPAEMQSDHAEKLLDILDIQNGQDSIFFTRNTGREPLQFYLTAAIAKLFGTGLSFISLRLGMVALGFLSLAYMYLLGKEFGGRWVGLLALLLMGVAYWPNVLARAGLRFILYPAFAAPTLYYLLRGLRRGALNDYLLCGLFLGVGLYGYTPFRIVPVVLVVALGIYWFHQSDKTSRRRALIGFALLILVSLVVFAPLMRYALENREIFSFRALSRLSSAEKPYPGPVWLIFLTNLRDALGMPVYSGGNIWLVGIMGRPALDILSGALYMLGAALLLFRYLRERRWQDLFLLLAVPLLMMPSILSLVYPEENPAMNRAGGATVAVFLLCAFALVTLVHAIKDRLPERAGAPIAWGFGVLLLFFIAGLNYDLVFNQYAEQYAQRSWNSSEMGDLIHDFARSAGSQESAWVVAYPYWVDTRLVAFNAEEPGRELGLWPDQLATTLTVPAPKLFILNLEDVEGLSTLQDLYPQGASHLETSDVFGKDFLVYYVGPSR